MADVNMPEKLWDLANLVTGFGVVQALATTYAIAKHELKGFEERGPHWIAAAGALVFTLLYVIAIRWCGRVGSSLDNETNSQWWVIVTRGRVAAVVIFNLLVLTTVYLHWRDLSRGR